MSGYPVIHEKPNDPYTYDRLDMLWEKYPQYHEKTVFSSLDQLLEGHESFREGFDELREEYTVNDYDRFLVQLSLNDLPYRHATKELIEQAQLPEKENPYVTAFLDQFAEFDTDRDACFLFPESYVSQFFVITEVCRRARVFQPIHNLFPDEDKVHYLAVFDKQNMDDVLLMFHLLYTNPSQDLFGGYSLYDYSLLWYQTHLQEDVTVLRSPYLPDRIAVYQGALPYCYNPVKTVYVRRNIQHILDSGYFTSELDLFLNLTKRIMPLLQWWYRDIALYEEKDGYQTNWRLERTKIRTDLTEKGIIKPKWKHELTLFNAVKKRYPDTLYQYRPDWLGLQSLDIFIPSLNTGIEYQGIQHYHPIDFFGGEEALIARWELDRQKKKLCDQNHVRLIEWPYDLEPTDRNIRSTLETHSLKEERQNAFLALKDFDEYMEKYESFASLRTSGLLFRKEAELMESDDTYTRREKENLRDKKKQEIRRRLHEEIETLQKETETEGVWILPVKGRKKFEYRYRYPNGKRGDVDHYLAGLYAEPKQLKENEFTVKIDRKNYELIELLIMGHMNLLTQYDPDQPDEMIEFLLQHNRIARIEYLMHQVNYYKEEYRSIRSIPDPGLKKLLTGYHRRLNDRVSRIYEYLIGEGTVNAKWKSEQAAYGIVLKHYPDARFQYSPEFLFQQKLDIFIPSVNTAIEYQGKQHYEPVEFFGGTEGHRRNKARDRRKYMRCQANGIKVLYWDYDQPLTDEYFTSEIMPEINGTDKE
ncbi:MAG: hypothetical protein IJI75_08280 [Solobacterium sp.]|nr:hypothetical protein [Solobacterium sp.]